MKPDTYIKDKAYGRPVAPDETAAQYFGKMLVLTLQQRWYLLCSSGQHDCVALLAVLDSCGCKPGLRLADGDIWFL